MKQTIANLISNYSFNQVYDQWTYGRISQLHFEAYCRVWEWMSPRFGGTPGWKHECFWKTKGKEAYYRKINRVRVAFGYQPLTAS